MEIKLKIRIKDIEIELSADEALELKDVLNKLIPTWPIPSYQPFAPVYYPPYYYYPTNYVTCGA